MKKKVEIETNINRKAHYPKRFAYIVNKKRAQQTTGKKSVH